MRSEEESKSLLRNAEIKSNQKVNDAVFEDMLDEWKKTESNTAVPAWQSLGRIIMKSKMTRPIAIAAIIAFALIISTTQIGGSGIAWGEVVNRITNIETFMFSLRIRMLDNSAIEPVEEVQAQWTIYVSSEHGFRMDIHARDKGEQDNVVSWFVPPELDRIITVIPGEKKWLQMPYSEDQIKEEKQKDPRQYIERFMSRAYTELGRKSIDGIVSEGIEVKDPPMDEDKLENAVGRLWVEVATGLPVLLEIEGIADNHRVQWLMDFRWGDAVDPKIFEPNIPDSYTLELDGLEQQ